MIRDDSYLSDTSAGKDKYDVITHYLYSMNALIREWKEKAEKLNDTHFTFLHSLKMRDEEPVDALARKLNDEVFSEISCLDCANCCKTIPPTLTTSDIKRISKHLGLSKKQFHHRYLLKDSDGEFTMHSVPCAFLEEDNSCSIYDVRPEACRSYPHAIKRGFSSRKYMHTENSLTCPAMFTIVERMRRRIGRMGL